MPTSSLKEFAQAIPVCKQTSSLAAVLEIFCSSGSDSIVVVSEKHCPLGVINVRQVMPYLIPLVRLRQTTGTMRYTPASLHLAGELHRPLYQLQPSIVEPLATLPAKLSLSEFWLHLKELGQGSNFKAEKLGSKGAGEQFQSRKAGEQRSRGAIQSLSGESRPDSSREAVGQTLLSPQQWALVDEEGKFLGLLNSWLLLKFLAPYLAALDEGMAANPDPQIASLKLLVQLLEQLPIPLSLQTTTGRVLAENPTWCRQIGTSPDLDRVQLTTARLDSPVELPSGLMADAIVDEHSCVVPDDLVALSHSTLAYSNTKGNSTESNAFAGRFGYAPQTLTRSPIAASSVTRKPHSLLAENTVQHYCAIDTPRMAATVSQCQVLLSTPTAFKAKGASAVSNMFAPDDVTTKKDQERVFSFIKIPLSPSVIEKTGVGAVPSGIGMPNPVKSTSKAATRHTLQPEAMPPYGELHNFQVKSAVLGGNQTPTHRDEQMERKSPTPISFPHPRVTPKRKPSTYFAHAHVPATPHAQTEQPPFELLSSEAITSNLCLVMAQDTTEQQQVAKELAAKNADLVQLNRLKDEFLACISHELKTPLTAVLGLSTLLKDQTLGQLNERQSRYARLIYQSGRQLMTVVNDILDVTRIETSQLELMLEPVQIQTVCDRAYSQAQQLQLDKDQDEDSIPSTQFTLEIEPELETLVADELRLRQMLMHLLSNALKFTEAGGEIGLRVNRWEGWIAFTVWDTGIGIPPEKQHLIFHKFQQLEKPLTRRFEGTGLGLVLTQGLARLHGGDVSFISKFGEGSQFTLLLPPCPPQARGQELNVEQGLTVEASLHNIQPANLQPATQEYRNRLVLIVETVPRYLEELTEQLKKLDYRVVIARSGTEAIEKARSLQPCTVLLNPLLPQLSGWDVLTLLKSDAQTQHIPIVVTATQAEKQHAFHHKADGFLSLPVQEQALLQSLTSLGQPKNKTRSSLTILHLSPDVGEIDAEAVVLSYELTHTLNLPQSKLNYRILEADDLEQAELLARVWHPDVILLDGGRLADPCAFLREFSLHGCLSSLPLVTLEHQTTEAANQVSGLSVYPCLAPDNSSKMAALLQVIQIATGMSRKPNILVMDIGGQDWSANDSREVGKISPSTSDNPRWHISSEETSEPDCVSQQRRTQKSTIATLDQTPHSSWLQALIQYLQTAGFRSLPSCSWTEVYRQLQDQSVDLLLICLRDITDTSALVQSLTVLTEQQKLPPILVLDQRLDINGVSNGAKLTSKVNHQSLVTSQQELAASLLDEAVTEVDSTADLELLLNKLATQILRGHSQSMTQLLDQIYQTLAVKS